MPTDPERYGPLMPALFREKLLYPASTFVLYIGGRASGSSMAVASLDLVRLTLFVTLWAKLAPRVA